MRILRTLLLLFIPLITNAQTVLKTEGQTYTNSADTWTGVNISRSSPTLLTFKNNSITSVNRHGYMLQAGDEREVSTNNNLDKAVITGNKFRWNGTDLTVITHGLFTGHNSDVIVKYNYLDQVPMGIIRKSTTNMSNTSGGVAYNIVKGGAVAIVVKGMSNVKIYNNTLYSSRTTSQTWRPLVHIYTNVDSDPNSLSHGTKIYNNIFYTKYQTFAISVDDNESLTGLECDYNVYWCENGSPRFSVDGETKTFAQWQAMGFDAHSVVVNPNFKDLVTFVPSARLDYGKDLGTEWQTGLSVNAKWSKTNPETANQNGKWQVGAVVYTAPVVPVVPVEPVVPVVPAYVSAVISNDKPSVIEATYNMPLANVNPPVSAFSVNVNSVPRPVNSVSVADTKVNLTLASPVVHGDLVTFSYTQPSASALSTATGGQAVTISSQTVQNNVVAIAAPEKPLYVSSVIQDATPTQLELTFNLALANIIPAASSFTATVNGNVRQVLSLSINGSKVSLVLQSPVKYNDAVTIGYTRPALNPLQSTAGGIAEGMVAQTVTNNILKPEEPVVSDNDGISIYPNPAREYISIANLKPSVHERSLKIFSYSGKLFMQVSLDSWNAQNIPVNLESGMYFVQILTGAIVEHSQALIIF